MMKIAFCIRANYLEHKGGDVIQLLKTKELLEKIYKIQGVIVIDPDELDNSYDIVHVFNLLTVEETLAFITKAKQLNIKIAISTIYWDYTYIGVEKFLLPFKFKLTPISAFISTKFIKIVSLIIGKPFVLSNTFKKNIKKMIDCADILLPNSMEEINKIIEFAKLDEKTILSKTSVIPNAADFSEVFYNIDILSKYKLPKEYVLQIGRIEFIKNQLQTIKALFNHPSIPIVFVGKPSQLNYVRVVKNLAKKRGNVFFIEETSYEEVQLFYRHALVHVLPSLRESPGLVSIEAIANKCKIVVSNDFFTPCKTYFENIASIANPLKKKDLERKILEEIQMNRDLTKAKLSIKNRFSWEVTAQKTYEAYKKLI